MKVPTLVTTRTQTPTRTQEYSRTSAGNPFAGLGSAVGALGVALQQREEKTDRFSALRNLSNFETRTAVQLQELQRNAAVDGKGFVGTAEDYYSREEEAFLASLPPSMQEEFSFRTAQIRQSVVGRALDFQYKAGDAYFRQGISDEYEKARSALDPRVGGDPALLQDQKAKLLEAIAATDLSSVEQNELWRNIERGLEGVGYRSTIASGGAIGAMPETVNAVIDEAAQRYGEDADVLRTIAWLESKGDPTARNPTSSAGGLFQFIDGTAKDYGLGDRFDPAQSADAAARLLRNNRRYLEKRLGRAPTKGELYLAHQQGAGGAAQLLLNPSKSASLIVGGEAVRLNGGRPEMSAAEFASMWIRKAEGVDPNIDQNPAFANLPYEDRLALRADATREIVSNENEATKAKDLAFQTELNTLLTRIHDGASGQMDIDAFREMNPGMGYGDLQKLNRALADYGSGLGLAAATLAKIESGFPIDPTSTDDKKGMNMLVGQAGLSKIGQGDQEYFANGIVPLVQRANDIPTDVMGLLTGMVRSNNATQSIFALDALAQLQDADPRAFDHRATEDLARDVNYWRARRNLVPHDELMKQLNPGVSQEERQQRQMLRQQGKAVLAQKERGVPTLETLVQNFVDEFDGWIWNAQISSVPWAAQGLSAEFQSLFIDEYERYGNAEEAAASATELLKKTWATTTIGDGKLMKYPPEMVGYRQYNGSFEWINDEIRRENGLEEGVKFELIADDKTAEEVERFKRDPEAQPPSYQIAVKNPDEGFYRILQFEGSPFPRRQYFQVPEETRIRDAEDFSRRAELQQMQERLLELQMAEQAAHNMGVDLGPEEREEYDELLNRARELQGQERIERGESAPDDQWSFGFEFGPLKIGNKTSPTTQAPFPSSRPRRN